MGKDIKKGQADKGIQFVEAIKEIEKTKGISKEVLFEAVEAALTSAYKKNYATDEEVFVEFDRDTGQIEVSTVKKVVDEVVDEDTEISLEEARKHDPEYVVGNVVQFIKDIDNFGRIAAQTAKQVVIQKIREAERNLVYEEYYHRIGELMVGVVHRISNETVFVLVEETEGVLIPRDQVAGETYRVGDLIKVLLLDVRKVSRGAQLYFSRTHSDFVKALLYQEVPEIEDGIVEIKDIVREAGARTKVFVYSNDENIDPVGTCVGARGSRIQAVLKEIKNERIDIVPWSEDVLQQIISALKPAKVEEVYADREREESLVIVPDNQLSLAIGKSGQNVRLAAKLVGYKIDIKTVSRIEALEAAGEFSRENPFGEEGIVEDTGIEDSKEEEA